MKFQISYPPTDIRNEREYVERLGSWLHMLAENLNITLANLGEDNFSASAKAKLFERKEENDDNV